MKQEIRSMLLELFKGKDSLTSKLKTRTDDLTKLDQEVFRFWQQDYFRNPITQAFKSRIDQSKQDIKSLQENQTLLIEYAESAVSNPSSFLVNAFKNEIEESKKKIAEQESLIANYSNPNRDPNTLYSTEDISRQLDESLALLERFIHMLYTIDNIKWHIEDSNYSEASPQEQKESTLETIAAIKTTLMQSIQTCSILAHLIYEQEKSPNQVLTIPNSYRETIHQ